MRHRFGEEMALLPEPPAARTCALVLPGLLTHVSEPQSGGHLLWQRSFPNVHGRHGFSPWVRKIPWRRKWQPTPVLLPGESHGQRNLEGCSPWGHTKSDTTIATWHTQCTSCIYYILRLYINSLRAGTIFFPLKLQDKHIFDQEKDQ